MASGQNNTDIKVPSEDIVRNFNAGIERCSYCWKQAEVTAAQGETNKSGDLYREGLEIAQELCRCFEAKIGNTQLREKPGRRDRQDSGIDSKSGMEQPLMEIRCSQNYLEFRRLMLTWMGPSLVYQLVEPCACGLAVQPGKLVDVITVLML
ncbi:uncharacterized protein LOC128205389 [Mya arenaria]|uniref:uncharacterized protein LOC128205389 n=1 Tax=Mya arenaria TaxID=6604 RepID=UPI0022E385D9|nr:uncharacterized protein LOC128205389 [Mya arenaria]